MATPTYTFVSVSTAKPGKLDDLARIASKPSELMDGKVPGLIARQVGVDKDRNSVIVWVTFDRKESLVDYLQTPDGQADHGDPEEMNATIATFDSWDLEPVSGRL